MTKHALLSASSSNRWLNCPPSARLNAQPETTVSSYALEGTEAHTLCEFFLKEALGMKADDPRDRLTFYTDEMKQAATVYVDHILECLEAAKLTTADPLVFIEQRLDFSDYVPEGFGTASSSPRTHFLFLTSSTEPESWSMQRKIPSSCSMALLPP